MTARSFVSKWELLASVMENLKERANPRDYLDLTGNNSAWTIYFATKSALMVFLVL